MEYVIESKDLTKRFGSFTAVDKLSVNIRKGEVFGFLGPNGAGKSTAIRMLCGILEPSSGSASVLGYDLIKETEIIKSNIGYMSQKFSLYDDLTVLQNLNFYAGIYNVPRGERKNRIQEMILMAQLTGREHELAVNLSGGWKQRLALGCAVIAKPSIVYLDEPTSGVSPTSRRVFFNIIQDMASLGTTVMVTTHFMDEAERCNKIAFISSGQLLTVDTPENLKNGVIEGYLVELDIPDGIERINDLEVLPYIKECSIHGSLLHVLLDNKKYINDLDNYTGFKASPIQPSLEDVFITLSKRRGVGQDYA